MALEKFDMDKKWFVFVATIAICFVVIEAGFIVVSVNGNPYDNEIEMAWYYNKLGLYGVNADYNAPSFCPDTHFYELSLGDRYAGQKLRFTVRVDGCSIIGAFGYIRDVTEDGNYAISDGNPDTVVRYGDSNVFTTTISDDISVAHPWIIMIAVHTTVYANAVPACRVYITMTQV